MAPNPRVAKAFRAMKELGISEEVTKPVLKNLLKIYDKNWQLIEEENYRALADAIFDNDETKAVEQKKISDNAEEEKRKKLEEAEKMKVIEEETLVQEEPDRPLRRTRLRDEDDQGSPSCQKKPERPSRQMRLRDEDDEGSPSFQEEPETPLRRIRLRDEVDEGSPSCINPSTNSSGNLLKKPKLEVDELLESDSPLKRAKNKGKQPILPDVLLKPKDESLVDDSPQVEVPTAVVMPESLTNGDTTTGNNLVKEPNCQAPPNETGDREPRNVSDESTAILDIASSSSGEMKISLIYNSAQGKPKFSADNVDSILKRVEDKCLQSYKVLDPNFSLKNLMKEMCECSLNLELGTDAIPPTDPPSDVDGDVSVSLAKIPKLHPHSNGVENNNYLTPDDIAKGQESVIVSLVNEVNNECLPSFHYITHNAVFQNAYVRFSLARIADDNCCPSCFGNCLTSTKPCPCALQSGGEFAYTAEGLVKEELLDECIKANRVPEKHLLSYCKECPLEKWKNEGNSHNLEACKGHFDRSFIKECWLKCGCSKSCGNRVVQRGIKHKLQVFMTPGGKGWGLRTLEDLPKGAFVCEFIGEVLTIKEFYQRVSQSSKKDEYAHPVLLDTDWGEGNEINEDEALCLDATNYGNVSRFINHRCFDSNLVEIPVEVENPERHYYHIAFFTTKEVKALEELTRDYGINFDEEDNYVKAFQCQCGSRNCRKI